MWDDIDKHLAQQSAAMDAALQGRAGVGPKPSPLDCAGGCRQMMTLAFWRAITAELLGTAMLVFFGTASTMSLNPLNPGLWPNVLNIAFTFGLIVAAMAYTFGHISGCHINPAVTLGVLLAGRINIISAIFYMIVQVGGGIIGSALLYALVDPHGNLGANGLAQIGVSEVQGFFIEVIMTMVLVMVVLAVTDAHRAMFAQAPLIIGLTVGVCHMIGVPTTGTSINPARALGPPIVKGEFVDYFWIYIAGPFVGAIIAAVLYRFWFDAYTPMKERCACGGGGRREHDNQEMERPNRRDVRRRSRNERY